MLIPSHEMKPGKQRKHHTGRQGYWAQQAERPAAKFGFKAQKKSTRGMYKNYNADFKPHPSKELAVPKTTGFVRESQPLKQSNLMFDVSDPFAAASKENLGDHQKIQSVQCN